MKETINNKEMLRPSMLVWVSDKSQEEADKDCENASYYYIWTNKDWEYVTRDDKWGIYAWKYISIKK